MTAQSTGRSGSAPRNPVAKDPALIVNFYGERGRLWPLIEHFVEEFALEPSGNDSYADRGDEGSRTLLHYFDPVAVSAHDTTIVQIALNAPGAVQAGWEAMRQRLEAAVQPKDDLLKEVCWGYTLIYQAELAKDIASQDAFSALLPAAQRLHTVRSQHLQPLAASDMPGGLLWLVDIPLRGDGMQAGTVYLALSQPDSESRLVRGVLYNKSAHLLMADLIAHKGYYEIRQYRVGDLDERYRENVNKLSDHTDELLGDLSQASATTVSLDQLASEYGPLVSVIKDLDQLHISLKRHEFNFSWWCKPGGGDDIMEFHHSQLENGTQELKLLVAEGQHPLEAAKTAVDMMQARLDKRQEAQRQRIETILSAAAVILSILVLVDKQAAQAFLDLIDIHKPTGVWPELAVQLACIVIFSVLTVFVIRLIRRAGHSR